MKRSYNKGAKQKERAKKATTSKSNVKKNVYSPPKSPRRSKPPRKKKSKAVKGVVLIIIALILIMITLLPLENYMPDLWGGPVYPERADFTIRRTITISSQRELSYNVTVPFPEDIPGNNMQFINNIEWNEEPDTLHKYGIEWKSWEESLDNDEREIIIAYNVNTSTVVWRKFNRRNSGTVDQIDPEKLDRYGGNQWQLDQDRNGDGENDWMIQPEHPEIRGLAEAITKNEATLYGKAQSIYDWMQRNMNYEPGGMSELPKHAIWTLETQRGDCDEWSFLYISLARAIGIPSWIELGVLYDRLSNQWGGHGWVRLQYVSETGDTGWVNIDTVNKQFFARDAMRITSYVDDGNGSHLSDYYHYVSYSYTGGNPGFQISEEYENIEMDSEGRVYLGEGYGIPWLSASVMLPVTMMAVLIYSFKENIKNGKYREMEK
ncbi:MAG: transglutaminase-like domain-containing protein [Thermoplasmata archaeon]